MPDINSFLKKNFNKFHFIGMFAGVILSLLYWYKAGQFSDNPLKKKHRADVHLGHLCRLYHL